MKMKPRPKGLSDVRRVAPVSRRDPLPLVREYQQKAIDESVGKARSATAPAAGKAKSMPIQYGFGGDEQGERHWIEVAEKRYFCDKIDEVAARQMVVDVQAAGQVLTVEQVKAAVDQLVETGRFWASHEAAQRARREAQSDPVKAHAAGVGYSGPAMPDKGLQDGSCNRSACQMPLAGKPQVFMRGDSTAGGRLHYCGPCGVKFDESDRQFPQHDGKMRCTALTPENRA